MWLLRRKPPVLQLEEAKNSRFLHYEGIGCKAFVYLGKLYIYEGLPLSFGSCRRCGTQIGCMIAKADRLIAWFHNTELLPTRVYTIPHNEALGDCDQIDVASVDIRDNTIFTFGYGGFSLKLSGRAVAKITDKRFISDDNLLFTVDGRTSALLVYTKLSKRTFRLVQF